MIEEVSVARSDLRLIDGASLSLARMFARSALQAMASSQGKTAERLLRQSLDFVQLSRKVRGVAARLVPLTLHESDAFWRGFFDEATPEGASEDKVEEGVEVPSEEEWRALDASLQV